MPIHLYYAPAGAGKTAFVLARARDAAIKLQATPRVVVPTGTQARAWKRRLAETGGALGVRVLTFNRLQTECLDAAGESYTELSDPVQYRLLRALVDGLPLVHYAPLKARPGFIQALQNLIGELKAARIAPDEFARAVGEPLRLAELAQIYTAYQIRLHEKNWADLAGLGWLAIGALTQRAPQVARDWSLLIVDGFDNFTQAQLALLDVLAHRADETLITLTGTDGTPRSVHQRFNQTRATLEKNLGIVAEPLPARQTSAVPALAYLQANLFVSHAPKRADATGVELIEMPDRAGEVRAAMRWLKQRIVHDHLGSHEVALLARAILPYRPFILQTAAEFGLPIRLVDGMPLRSNPAIAALIDLVRMMLPHTDRVLALPRRLVIEAWRSPYFDWRALPADDAPQPIGIEPGDAEALDMLARWGRVIGGRAQWDETFAALSARAAENQDDEQPLPSNVPTGEQARALNEKFQRFVQRLMPPSGARTFREFVGWLEAFIGPDPTASQEYGARDEPMALNIVACARAGDPAIAALDVAALQSLKDVLRGLVWAEEAVQADEAIDLVRFYTDLTGALDAATYRPPLDPSRDEILVADVIQARGVGLRAIAVLGLAEGEFPATLGEDPFLRDADRQRLRAQFNFALEDSVTSAESEFFYETITRPREGLLLTRPRLADNGAPWQASPFWEQVRRLLNVAPTNETAWQADHAASWSEWIEALSARADVPAREWMQQHNSARWDALRAATQVVRARTASAPNEYDGNLGARAAEFARRFAPAYTWSASRLENYRACPFFFFTQNVLRLEPRVEPTEGLDVRQKGNLYHRIFKAVYEAVPPNARNDAAELVAALNRVAPPILDDAPAREGFRATRWWQQTRLEMIEHVRASLEALCVCAEDYVPLEFEVRFANAPIRDGSETVRLRGAIDRVDRARDGKIRILDYKTGGPSSFTAADIVSGKKLQIPLYALAARDALNLGRIADGFYWHVEHAEPSKFSLQGFKGGADVALRIVIEKTLDAVHGARAAQFVPAPPDGGCPAYCPAAAFCWHYTPRAGY